MRQREREGRVIRVCEERDLFDVGVHLVHERVQGVTAVHARLELEVQQRVSQPIHPVRAPPNSRLHLVTGL